MHVHATRRRLWWIAARLFTIVLVLAGSQIALAQPPAPASEQLVYMPLVSGGSGAAQRSPVRLIADSQRAAHAAIGPEGGQLSAVAANGTRYELLIPPDALDFAEVITMTPVLRAENLPLSGGLVGAVSLEPAGLDLYTPALLRVIPPKLAPAPLTIGFAYNGDGAQFHPRPLAGGAGAAQLQAGEPVITMEIIWIRPVGVGRGSQADIDAIPIEEADLPDPGDYLEAQMMRDVAEKLDAFYYRHLVNMLHVATTSPAKLDLALRTYDSWIYFVESLNLTNKFDFEIRRAKELMTTALRTQAGASAERCFSQKRPEEGFRLLRWMRYARKYLGSAEAAAIQAKLGKCLRFELTFHSHMTEGGFGDPFGYLYDLQAKVTLRGTTGMNATGSGPLEWNEVSWIGSKGACTISVAGVGSTFDAQKPGFGLSITPVSRTSPAVNITLRYHPGTPGEETSIECPGGGGVEASTQAWATYFGQTHENERDGAGYRVTAQVVGAGSFPGWNYPRLTTSGPSGQAVIEATVIELVHAPER